MAENKKKEIYDELVKLVEKYNKSAEYAEYKTMKELDSDMKEKVDEYTLISWNECVASLAKAENPLVEAAKMLKYKTVRVADRKLEEGGTERVIEEVMKPINPLQLHKKVKGGVGADKTWGLMVQKLNYLLTCRRGIELGLDASEIENSYAMSEQAAKLDGFVFDVGKYDKNKADEVLKQDLQKVLLAMFGEGVEVTDAMVAYLLMVYTKKGTKKALSVITSTHKALAMHLLDLGHEALTDDTFNLSYKVKK